VSEEIRACPLCWPPGWRRIAAADRKRAQFNKRVAQYREERDSNTGVSRRVHAYDRKVDLSVADATKRILDELTLLGVQDRGDIVISTNIRTRLDGLPYSNATEPRDPGVAVYWRRSGEQQRCMAVDRYDRVADNLAAIAATLEAMRAIERHGGAAILDRAFTGFQALPAPDQWWQILGIEYGATREQIEHAHRRLAMEHHPDRGGDSERMARINAARDQGLA